MKYGDVDFKEVNFEHVCAGVLSNASGFPTIPENIARTDKSGRDLIFNKLMKYPLLELEKSEENRNIILNAFEIVLMYMDESDIWSTIDYPKPIVQKVYEELKIKWT